MLAADLPSWVVRLYALSWGAIWGSFANVVIYRWPHGLSVTRPGSRCPHCGHSVRAYDNVPVLAWLWLRGRCRDCRAPIAPRYALVEAVYALVALAIADPVFSAEESPTAVTALAVSLARYAFAWGLLTAAFIDLDTLLIPDEISVGGTVLALLASPLLPGIGFRGALLGAALGFGIPYGLYLFWERVLHREGMGLGDAKLLALIGAFLGPPGVLFALSAGALQGLIAASVARVTGARLGPAPSPGHPSPAVGTPHGRTRPAPDFLRIQIPFGPFLSLAAIEYMLGAGALFTRALERLSGG